MKKMTKKQPLEDDVLVNFLQTYSRPTPLENKPCEDLIMRSIAQHKSNTLTTKKLNPRRLFWLLPFTIFSGFLMLSGHLFRQKLSPQLVSDYQDMDSFMINTWQESMVEEEPEEDFFFVNEEYPYVVGSY